MSDNVTSEDTASDEKPEQLLHIVMGGRLTDLADTEFEDVSKLDIVGVYPNYAKAHEAWKSAAQRTVDDAQMRYFIVHLHKLLDPDNDADCPD
ncbi:DUF4170 domain-containing protein [Pyruvatibacter sp.]|uniref:DUF4170 domain-containing protein n=1 Tax=Pyruvatibacter sp. TaxID=1981328 RepID=UPI003267FCBD